MRKILSTLFLVCLAVMLPAQNDDYRQYMQNAADAAVVFRGSQAIQYNFAYNGTPYWKTPAFNRGDVCYNGKMYYGLNLNIDAVNQTLLLKNEAGIAVLALSGEEYDSFTINGTRFIRTDGKIYEIIWDGRSKVFKQLTKVQERDIEGRKNYQTGYEGNFNSNIHTVFIEKVRYYYLAEGSSQMKELTGSRKSILKNYKAIRREVSSALSNKEKGEKMPNDDYYRFIMQYIESR